MAATAVLGKRGDRQLVAEQATDDFRMNLRVSKLRWFIFVSPVSEEKGRGEFSPNRNVGLSIERSSESRQYTGS